MENKSARLLVVPQGKALDEITPPLNGDGPLPELVIAPL